MFFKFLKLLKEIQEKAESLNRETISIEPISVSTECIMEKKVGPFEKWNVINSEPMYTKRLFGNWFVRYSRQNYLVIQ